MAGIYWYVGKKKPKW